MTGRIKKINELIRQEINQLILKEIGFKEILVTITGVDTSPDLKHAKIKLSIWPKGKDKAALEILNKNIFHLQKGLNKRLYMKPVPKIEFEIDKLEKKAQRVEKILEQIKSNGQVAK